MRNTIFLFSIALVFLVLASCEETEINPYVLPQNAIQLIAGDSTKTWKIARRYNGDTRMNMGRCFLSYRQTFSVNNTVVDNNKDNTDCGPSLRATWKISVSDSGNSYLKLTSDQIPELFKIKKDYKFFKVLYVSEDSLTLSFKHKQFSGKTRIIIDYLVREDLKVNERDFHW